MKPPGLQRRADEIVTTDHDQRRDVNLFVSDYAAGLSLASTSMTLFVSAQIEKSPCVNFER